MTALARALIALLLVAVIATAGCGDDDDDGGEDTSSALELVDRLPQSEISHGVMYVDVEAMREALGLDADLDPATAFVEGTDEERRFATTVGAVVTYMISPFQTAIGEAIDEAQITAAANNLLTGGEEGMTLIETEQSFDEIASVLEERGFERDGDVLTTEEPFQEAGAQAVAGGNGLVALGSDPATVEAAVGDEVTAPTGPERELIAELGGPAAGAFAGRGEDCVEAIGLVDRMAGGEGEFVLAMTEPDPQRFKLGDQRDLPFTTFQFGEVTADGNEIRAPFTVPLAEANLAPLGFLLLDIPADMIYDCPG